MRQENPFYTPAVEIISVVVIVKLVATVKVKENFIVYVLCVYVASKETKKCFYGTVKPQFIIFILLCFHRFKKQDNLIIELHKHWGFGGFVTFGQSHRLFPVFLPRQTSAGGTFKFLQASYTTKLQPQIWFTRKDNQWLDYVPLQHIFKMNEAQHC